MNKEEAKQYIRDQINSCVKIQDKFDMDIIYLCYNKQYIRALKFSKITGKPVNQENFKGGEKLFWVDTKYKEFWYYSKIEEYLYDNYSIDYYEQSVLVKEIFNEYKDYKVYNVFS